MLEKLYYSWVILHLDILYLLFSVRGLTNRSLLIESGFTRKACKHRMLKPIKRGELLYEAAQTEIKEYIITHRLKSGDPLPTEMKLAEHLGVSRNSVREAVKALEAVGVLESRAGAGLFVSDFSFDPLLRNMAYGLM